MKNRLQFNRHFALYNSREEAITALNNRIADTSFIPLIGEPIVLRYKDEAGNIQVILAIGKKAGTTLSEREYHVVDTAELNEKIEFEAGRIDNLSAGTVFELDAVNNRVSELSATTESFSGATDDFINRIITAAGLAANGDYVHDHSTYYIDEVASLAEADHALDAAAFGILTNATASASTLNDNATASANTLNTKIDGEIARATAAEESISGSVDTFSAKTVAEITRLDDKIDAETARAIDIEDAIANNVGILSGATVELSASTVHEIARLDDKIDAETARATAAEEELLNKISAATVASRDKTVVIDPSPIGTDLSVNIDGITIVKDNNGVLGTKLSIVKLATPSSVNVKEEYALVDNNGTHLGETVKVYKDASLKKVELVTISGKEYLRFTYILADGSESVVDIDVSAFLSETEFKDGLTVSGGQVYVLIDPLAEDFLSVSSNGVKLAGVQNAINAAAETERLRAVSAETAIRTDLNAEVVNRTNADTLLSNAINAEISARTREDSLLNDEIEGEIARATAAENEIRTNFNDFTATTQSNISALTTTITAETTRATAKETELQTAIDGEVTRATAAETALNTKVENETSRATGVENEIKSNFNTFTASTQSSLADLNSAIATETADRISGDGTLNTKIEAETARAIGAESALTSSLNTEKSRAMGEESRLDAKIDAEITRATGRENSLSTSITTAVNDLTAAYTEADDNIVAAYTAAIAQEATSRMDTDNRLERMISSASSEISGVEARLNNEITRATTAENAIAGDVQNLSAATVSVSGKVGEVATGLATLSAVTQEIISGGTGGNVTELSAATMNLSAATTALSVASANYFDGAEYDSTAKRINFKHGSEIKTYIDATDFIKDGMVSAVTISGGSMIISFNTDAGREDITLELTDIFNPDNYYTKDEINNGVSASTLALSAATVEAIDDLGILSGAFIDNTYVVSLSLNDLNNKVNEISGNTGIVDGLSAATVSLKNNVTALSAATTGISNNLNALSAATTGLSAGTVAISNNVSNVSGAVINLSAATMGNLNNLSVLSAATVAISNNVSNVLSGVLSLSAATTGLSAATVIISGHVTDNANDIQALSATVMNDEFVISEAINNLNDRLEELSGATLVASNYYTTANTYNKTEVDENIADAISGQVVFVEGTLSSDVSYSRFVPAAGQISLEEATRLFVSGKTVLLKDSFINQCYQIISGWYDALYAYDGLNQRTIAWG